MRHAELPILKELILHVARRRMLARTFTHSGIRIALDKFRGTHIDPSIEPFMRLPSTQKDPVPPPDFIRTIAKVFIDAQTKRHDADYNMNKPLDEIDARLLHGRVARAISDWRAADTAEDRDVKDALCLMMLLRGQLRRDP